MEHTFDTIDDVDNLETIPFAPVEELERARRAARSSSRRALRWLSSRRRRVVVIGLMLGIACGAGLPALLVRLF